MRPPQAKAFLAGVVITAATAAISLAANALDRDLQTVVNRLNDLPHYDEADLAPQAVAVIYQGGQTLSLNRAQLIAATQQARAMLVDYKIDDLTIINETVKDDLATVVYTIKVGAKMGGAPFRMQALAAETYVRNGGRWQLLTSVSKQ